MKISYTIAQSMGQQIMIIDMIDQEEPSLFYWSAVQTALQKEGLTEAHILHTTPQGVRYKLFTKDHTFKNAPKQASEEILTYLFEAFSLEDAKEIMTSLGFFKPTLNFSMPVSSIPFRTLAQTPSLTTNTINQQKIEPLNQQLLLEIEET